MQILSDEITDVHRTLSSIKRIFWWLYIWQALPWSYCTTNNRILSVKFEIKPMFRRTNSNMFKSDSCAPARMPNPIILRTLKFWPNQMPAADLSYYAWNLGGSLAKLFGLEKYSTSIVFPKSYAGKINWLVCENHNDTRGFWSRLLR